MKEIFNRKKIMSVVTALAITALLLPASGAEAYAASKTPETPKITSTYVDGTSITIKWSKAKRANKYQIAVRSANKKWKYLKSVKKTAKNKKRYTKKNAYKVVKAGKKYKVYKYRYTYTILKTTGSKTYSYVYNAPKGNTKYTLRVRAKNKKGTSSWTAYSRTTQAHKHNWEKIYRQEDTLVTKEVETVVGREAYCSECGMTIAASDDKDVNPEVTEEEKSSHESETGHECIIEYRDKIKTETKQEPVSQDVLDHYECKCNTNDCCYAEKALDGTIKIHSHKWGEDIVSEEPTCEANGSYTHTCSKCGLTVKTTIPKLGHNWGDEFVSVEPTCTKAGSYSHACSRCGATEKTRTIAKLGHKKATREVTKTEYKTEYKWHDYVVCKDCGKRFDLETEADEFDAHQDYEIFENNGTGSWYMDEVKEEVKTPYEGTYIETYCTRCGKILSSVKKK